MERKRHSRTAKRAPVSAGQRIIAGLKEAIAGNLVRVTIDGQVWERKDPHMKRDQRIRRIMNRCTDVVSHGEHHNVRLKIDHQTFTITAYPLESMREVNFYRKALATALNRFKHGD